MRSQLRRGFSPRQLPALVPRALYGVAFMVVVPLFLAYWASSLDRSIDWALPGWTLAPALMVAFGGLALVKGMLDLMTTGHGLPMNPYPPTRLVTTGIYALFAHPIYAGAVFISAGLALWFHSSGGLYLVTPVLAFMTVSLFYGYERLALQRRFGDAIDNYQPLFSLPGQRVGRVKRGQKVALLAGIFGTWLACGYLVDTARGAGSAGAFTGLFDGEQWLNWSKQLWLVPFAYVALKLLFSRTGKAVHKAGVASTLAASLNVYLYLILPALGVDVVASAWTSTVTAVMVTTAATNYGPIWSTLQRLSESVANSRRDWLFAHGHFRVINHSIYAGLASAVGVGLAGYVVGNGLAVLMLTICALVGAAAWAQFLWSSSALLRPFGYWGAVLGAAAGTLLVHFSLGIPLWTLALAGVLCAPFVQAIGRLRCLVQGCCHGVPTDEGHGIRVWQSQSRVVALSGLRGQPILNTQLHSILFNVFLGFLMWAAWRSNGLSSAFIIGLYFIGTGLERFVEDAYRGERQTRLAMGLRENQWIAVAAVVVGIWFTMLSTPLPAAPAGTISASLVALAISGGLLGAFVMGMDFPKSTLRFSRLSG